MTQDDAETLGNPRREHRTWSLGARLAISFSLAFVLVLAFIEIVLIYGLPFGSYSGRLGEERAEALARLDLIVELKKERIERWIEVRRDDAQVLSRAMSRILFLPDPATPARGLLDAGERRGGVWELPSSDRDRDELARRLEELRVAYGVYDRISIADAVTGTVVISTDSAALGAEISGEAYFAQPLRSRETYVGPAVAGSGGAGSFIHISHVIEGARPAGFAAPSGEAIGVMIMTAYTDEALGAILRTGNVLGLTGEALLVDQDGWVFTSLKRPMPAGSPPVPLEHRIDVGPSVLPAAGQEGLIETRDYRGERVLAAYRYIAVTPEWGWGLIVKYDRAELFAPLRQDMIRHILLGLAGVVIFAGLSFVLAGMLTRPIRRLSETAKRVADGDLSARGDERGSDEVGILAATFNAMLERIQNWHGELEAAVRARTADLHESERRARATFEHAAVGVVHTARDGKYLDVNDSFAAMLGYTRGELLERSFVEVTHPDDVDAGLRLLRKLLGGEIQTFSSEKRYLHKNGSIVWGHPTVSLARDPVGEEDYVIAVIEDITRRKRAEEEVQRLAHENEVLAEIGRTIASSLDVDEVYERFCEQVRRLIPFDWITIATADMAQEQMCVEYVYGIPEDAVTAQPGYTRPLAGSILEEVMRRGTGILSVPRDRDELFRELAAFVPAFDLGTVSQIAVPLVRSGEVIGMLDISSAKRQAYTADDLRMAERVANQIAGAIANARLFAEQRRAEAEMQRLADELKDSEEQFRDLYMSAPISYFTVGIDGLIKRCNKAAETLIGRPASDLVGRPVTDLYSDSPQGKERALAVFQRFASGRVSHYEELEWQRADGTAVWVSLIVDIARGPGGEIRESRSMAVDITEQRRAEEALRDSEERYRAVTESATDAIVSADGDGNVIFWNAAAQRAFGFEREEILGKPMDMIMPERYRQAHMAGIRRVATSGGSGMIGTVRELMGLRRGGAEFPIELALSTFRSGGERFFTAIIRDVTERRQAEVKAQELALFPQLNPAPLLRFDSHGVIVTANPAAVALLGALREEAMSLEAVLPVMADIDVDDLVRQGLQVTREAMIGRRHFQFFVLGVPERGMGHAYGFDITERKELQAQLLQAQKMEVVGQLAGGVAHDFNNLLTGILGFASMSREKLPPGHVVGSYLAEIQSAAERAAAITRQLLTFSRREMAEPRVVDLNQNILSIVGMLRRLIGEDIELVTLPSLKPALVRVDPAQIEQVLINLAINARDAMPEGGKLTIEVAEITVGPDLGARLAGLEPGLYVMFSVKDTGAGMNENVLEHLFEPFFTTKEQGKGTGLGLSTCYGIISEYGGDILVSSEPGRGSAFEVYLPLVEEKLSLSEDGGDPGAASGGTETVLLVEDEPSVRRLASLVLRQQGYTVLEASNGEEALEVVQHHGGENIQLLLTDIVMPHMGGWELADRLLAQFPETKVIYTSGYPEGALAQPGGPNDGILVLRKPYAPAVVAEKVREVLDAPQPVG